MLLHYQNASLLTALRSHNRCSQRGLLEESYSSLLGLSSSPIQMSIKLANLFKLTAIKFYVISFRTQSCYPIRSQKSEIQCEMQILIIPATVIFELRFIFTLFSTLHPKLYVMISNMVSVTRGPRDASSTENSRAPRRISQKKKIYA